MTQQQSFVDRPVPRVQAPRIQASKHVRGWDPSKPIHSQKVKFTWEWWNQFQQTIREGEDSQAETENSDDD